MKMLKLDVLEMAKSCIVSGILSIDKLFIVSFSLCDGSSL